MKQNIAIGLIVALVVGVSCLLLYPWKRVERRQITGTQETEAILSATQETVASRITELFTSGKQRLPERFTKFMLIKPSEPLFPDDFQLQAHAREDAALRPYAALRPEQRQTDFYLYEPTGDFYWHSEFYWNDEPANFSCNFLIHLEPAAAGKTKVEVLEVLPRIWLGRHFGLGHSGPGFYRDIRRVEATVSDRAELLAVVKTAL